MTNPTAAAAKTIPRPCSSIRLSSLIAAAAAMIFAFTVPSLARDLVDQTNAGNSIFRVAKNSNGEQFVEISWAVGTIENIKNLRVPWGYRSLLLGDSAGAQLIDNGHEESKKNGFATGFAFSAMTSDMKAHTGCDPASVANNRDGDTFQGLVYGGINPKYRVWDERRIFNIPIVSGKGFLYTGPERSRISLVQKSPRFGLNRIGPERFVVENWRKSVKFGSPIYSDMWFDGATPETSTVIVICGSDEDYAGRETLDQSPNYNCTQYFTVERLSARAQIRFRKQHLSEWRKIHINAVSLITSFLPE